MKINFAQISVIEQLKSSPERLALQKQSWMTALSSTECVITGVTLFPGVWLTPLVLHISFTRPRANNWGKLFLGSGLIFNAPPFLFLNSVSKITKAFPLVPWPETLEDQAVRFPSSGETQSLHAVQLCPLFPHRAPLQCGHRESSDLLRGSGLHTFTNPGRRPGPFLISSNFLWIQRKLFIPECVKTEQ